MQSYNLIRKDDFSPSQWISIRLLSDILIVLSLSIICFSIILYDDILPILYTSVDKIVFISVLTSVYISVLKLWYISVYILVDEILSGISL